MKLYRFCKIDPYTISALSQNYLWFSNPTSFNDPFDCNLAIDPTGDVDDWMPLISSIQRQRHSEDTSERIEQRARQFLTVCPVYNDKTRAIRVLKEVVSEVRQKIGVCCFSSRYDSILLWSHYADSHRGICVEYDSDALALNDMYQTLPVIYAESHPNMSIARKTVQELATVFVTAKSIEWAYEKEYRIVSGHKGIRQYDPRSLTSITFGCRALKRDVESVLRALETSGAAPQTKRAIIDEGWFKLRFENLIADVEPRS